MSTVALRGRGARARLWRRVAERMMVTVAHAFGRVPATVSVITAQQAGADATLVGTDPPPIWRLPVAGRRVAAVDRSNSAVVRPGQLAILVGRSPGADLTASVSVINRVAGAWQTWLGDIWTA